MASGQSCGAGEMARQRLMHMNLEYLYSGSLDPATRLAARRSERLVV